MNWIDYLPAVAEFWQSPSKTNFSVVVCLQPKGCRFNGTGGSNEILSKLENNNNNNNNNHHHHHHHLFGKKTPAKAKSSCGCQPIPTPLGFSLPRLLDQTSPLNKWLQQETTGGPGMLVFRRATNKIPYLPPPTRLAMNLMGMCQVVQGRPLPVTRWGEISSITIGL